MRILHVCQSADPNIGGSLVVARSLAEAQADEGADARVVYLYRSPYDSNTSQRRCAEAFLGVERATRYTRGIKALRQYVGSEKPTIIHHHDGLLWPRIGTRNTGVPLVTHGHLGAPNTGWWAAKRITHEYIVNHTNLLIAVSEWVSDSWEASGFPRERIKLIYNGVDSAKFRRRTATGDAQRVPRLLSGEPRKKLLWLGRFDKHTKGLDRLLLVIRNLPRNWCCVIVGDGPDRSWLAENITLEAVGDRTVMVGKVSEPAEWFANADAFLFTSRVEPFGLVLLEAASSEIPILAFPCIGGGSELLRILQARLIGESSPTTISEDLNCCLENTPYRSVRSKVNDLFSWRKAALESIQAYHELSAGLQQ